jgi:hypothetical protein
MAQHSSSAWETISILFPASILWFIKIAEKISKASKKTRHKNFHCIIYVSFIFIFPSDGTFCAIFLESTKFILYGFMRDWNKKFKITFAVPLQDFLSECFFYLMHFSAVVGDFSWWTYGPNAVD